MELSNEQMEEILSGIKDIQHTNLEILSRITNVEDRITNVEDKITSVEDRLTNIETSQFELVDRIGDLERNTIEGFVKMESKLNNVIISNQLMNYTYDSIKQDHKLHSRFLLSLSKRISNLEKKKDKD